MESLATNRATDGKFVTALKKTDGKLTIDFNFDICPVLILFYGILNICPVGLVDVVHQQGSGSSSLYPIRFEIGPV